MSRYLNDATMGVAALALAALAGVLGFAYVTFGHEVIDEAGPRAIPLLYISSSLSLLGAALVLVMPAVAGFVLLVGVSGWLGLALVFTGLNIAVVAPLLACIVATALALVIAGAQEILRSADYTSIYVGKLFAFSVVILTVVVCYEVFMRYVLRMPTRWGYDAGYMLYGAGFIMAGAYALAQNAHVRADVIYRFWRPRVQASVDLVLFLLFFFPAAFFFVYQGYLFAERSWMIREFSSASPFNIPVYHYKTLIPIAGVFLFLQGIAEVVRALMCLRDGYWPDRMSDVEEIEKQAAEGHIPVSVAGVAGVPVQQVDELGLEVDPPSEKGPPGEQR